MTHREEPPLPTEAELELLGVLWEKGPSTVREVHAALPPGREVRYTTVLKLLQIMAEKGLVRRDESRRAHVYAPASHAARTQRRIVADLVERAFGGSASRLVQQALSSRPASAEEIREIRELLDALERGRGGRS
jgi:predicted transcriptional regulator